MNRAALAALILLSPGAALAAHDHCAVEGWSSGPATLTVTAANDENFLATFAYSVTVPDPKDVEGCVYEVSDLTSLSITFTAGPEEFGSAEILWQSVALGGWSTAYTNEGTPTTSFSITDIPAHTESGALEFGAGTVLNGLITAGSGQYFTYTYTMTVTAGGSHYYLDLPVPLPGAGAVMIPALMGLGAAGLRRRRRG